MKLINFIIFFSIVIIIYGAGNYYLFIRGWQSIPKDSALKIYYLIVFLLLSLSFIAGRLLERFTICTGSFILVWIGSFWLGLLLYLILSVLFLDILRLLDYYLKIFPAFITSNYIKVKQATALIVILLSAIIIFVGYINALHPRINEINIKISNGFKSPVRLNIILVTDIHLGTIVGNSKLIKLVDYINSTNTDIVLLGGDIVDEDIATLIEKKLGEPFKNIKSKYGTYAVTGNHEYIGGVNAAYRYLTEHNITVLRDRAIKIGNFFLAGREDLAKNQFTGKKRKPLHEILKNVEKGYPVILMDHQPLSLKEAVKNKVDLQLSGHTHGGQLWPVNYITGLIFEKSQGYKKIENTHLYVSSGYGTWGPPVRIGNRPEIVNINLTFE